MLNYIGSVLYIYAFPSLSAKIKLNKPYSERKMIKANVIFISATLHHIYRVYIPYSWNLYCYLFIYSFLFVRPMFVNLQVSLMCVAMCTSIWVILRYEGDEYLYSFVLSFLKWCQRSGEEKKLLSQKAVGTVGIYRCSSKNL